MSQDVKRWEPCLKDSPAGTFVTMRETRRVRDVFVSVSEHEAVVAELKAENDILRSKASQFESTLKETMRVRDAEIEKLKRVVEKLREQRNYYCDMAQMPDKSYQEHLEECDAELDAIEKGKGLG